MKYTLTKRKGIALLTAIIMLLSNSTIIKAQNIVKQEEEKEYIVHIENSKKYDQVAEKYEEQITENVVTEILEEENIFVAKLTEQELKNLKSEDNAICIEENFELCASGKTIENQNTTTEKEDSDTEMEWNLKMIGMEEVKNQVHTPSDSNRIKVAVLDSGIDVLEDINVVERVNLVSEEQYIAPYFEDLTGHGTSIAGLIADINENADIYSVRILDSKNKATLNRVVEGIYWCIENDIDIINMSFGTPTKSKIMEKAIEDAEKAGILMIASAGNGGMDADIEYPAAFDAVMAVGSVDTQAERTEESAVGNQIEIMAPGEQIKAVGPFGGEVITSGTSMAVPHVVGSASLLWQEDKGKSADFIRDLIDATAKDIGEERIYGNGLIDTSYALENYAAFKEGYSNSNAKYQKISQNTNEAETFDDIEYVEGRWGGIVHKSVCEEWEKENLGSIKLNQIQAMKNYSIAPDLDVMPFEYLHGDGNYVAAIKYLYEVASLISRDSTIDTLAKVKTAYNSITMVGASDAQVTETKNSIYKVCQLSYDELKAEDCGLAKNKEYAARIMGMAIHVAGDTYAHRALVPTTVVFDETNTDPKNALPKTAGRYIPKNKIFIKFHFIDSTWSAFIDAVQSQIPFSSIGHYVKTFTDSEGNTYKVNHPDSTVFYPRRYTIGMYDVVTDLLIQYQYTPAKTINVSESIWHSTYCSELKLYKLKTFLDKTYPNKGYGTEYKSWSFKD